MARIIRMKAQNNAGSFRFSMKKEDAKLYGIEHDKTYQFDLVGEIEKQKVPKLKE